MTEKSTHKEYFSTRLGLILAVLGIAVGTGNIWRFPRIAAQTGGQEGAGVFIIAWLIFLFIFSIPLIIGEYAIGRESRKGVIGSFIEMAGERFAWMGTFIAWVTTAIMFYYSVVTGWCLYYFFQTLFTELPATMNEAQMVWQSFQGSALPSVFHAIMMAACGYVIVKGVSSIEKVNKIMIPTLVVVLLISLIRALTLPGAFEGVAWLFTPDWSTITNPRLWVEALAQSAWDTGAAWGLILTYAIYMRKKDDVSISAFQTGIGDSIISLLAATIIFSTVFGILGARMSDPQILEVMKTAGPASTGLTFMWMPQLFAAMPGGRVFAILFFLGLTFAAFTSLVSMIELSSRIFIDMGVSRKKAAIGVCVAGFLFGLPSAISVDFLANQDFVWGVGLMISGAFMSFGIIKYNTTKFRRKLVNNDKRKYTLGSWWEIVIKYVVPVEVITLLGWWIYLSAFQFAPDSWYNPFSMFSIASVLVQWGIAMGLFYLYNKPIAKTSSKE